MALNWCFSTLGCPELGLDAVLALAQRYGFVAVELRFLNNSTDLVHELEEYLSVPNNADRLRWSGIAIVALLSSFDLAKQDANALPTLQSLALLADRMDVPYVRVFYAGKQGDSITPETEINAQRNYAAWRAWKQATRAKAELIVETHGSSSSSASILRLWEILGTALPLIWDMHHTMILAGEEPAHTWSQLGSTIKHVHVKDSIAVLSEKHPYTYVLPGQGRMPVRQVLSLLEANYFAGAVSLEWEKPWHPYLPPLEEAFAAMATAGWR